MLGILALAHRPGSRWLDREGVLRSASCEASARAPTRRVRRFRRHDEPFPTVLATETVEDEQATNGILMPYLGGFGEHPFGFRGSAAVSGGAIWRLLTHKSAAAGFNLRRRFYVCS